MSIVSRKIDMQVQPVRKHVIKAVGFDAGDPQYAPFQQTPQKPNFNVSKNIRKHVGATPDWIHGTPGNVPQKCNQFDTQGGNMLFYAPQAQDIEVLRVPVYRASYQGEFETDPVDVPFDVPLDLKKGIRGGMRPLKFTPVVEPTGPQFRLSQPATAYTRVRPVPTRLQFEDEIVRQVRAL